MVGRGEAAILGLGYDRVKGQEAIQTCCAEVQQLLQFVASTMPIILNS